MQLRAGKAAAARVKRDWLSSSYQMDVGRFLLIAWQWNVAPLAPSLDIIGLGVCGGDEVAGDSGRRWSGPTKCLTAQESTADRCEESTAQADKHGVTKLSAAETHLEGEGVSMCRQWFNTLLCMALPLQTMWAVVRLNNLTDIPGGDDDGQYP